MKNLIFFWFTMSAIGAYGQDTTLSQQVASKVSKLIEKLCDKKDFCYIQKASLSFKVISNALNETQTSQSIVYIGYQDVEYKFLWPQFEPRDIAFKSKCMEDGWVDVTTPPEAHTSLDKMIESVLEKCHKTGYKEFD
jgi:hypothetical protein